MLFKAQILKRNDLWIRISGMAISKRTVDRILMTVVGNLIFALGINLLINPIHLYSGGFTGISQLVRMFIVEVLHMPEIPGVDYMGVIYFLLNVPLFIMAYKVMGRQFCITTLGSIAMVSVFMALIPVPEKPIVADPMLAAVTGGIITGTGAGLLLRAGTSQGGQDIIGICMAKLYPNFKVGTIGIIISIMIYSVCLFVYDIPTVLYSIIFTVLNGIFINRVHVQNIKQECIIFTKVPGLGKRINDELGRGVTTWKGEGVYTGDDVEVLTTVVSKYEEPFLRKILKEHDPDAFVIISDNVRVHGHFEKKFTD